MKLDNFSKIQVATFGIQFMASSMKNISLGIQVSNNNLESGNIPDPFNTHLQTLSDKLSLLYEETANLLNDHDAISLIDCNLLSVPSDVLLFGKDDTEEDYYSPNIEKK